MPYVSLRKSARFKSCDQQQRIVLSQGINHITGRTEKFLAKSGNRESSLSKARIVIYLSLTGKTKFLTDYLHKCC